MFTGIIEALGEIKKIERIDMSESGGGGFSITIQKASIVLQDAQLGDSISCNGVCLTVTEFNSEMNTFKVGISPETIRKTNLGLLREGETINLERSMSGTSRFGGHFVQGHVDCTVKIKSITKDPPNSLIYHFHVPTPVADGDADYLTYIIPKGYVALDGTSLTVIDVDWKARLFSVMLIAYTQERVVLTRKQVGSTVNLEVDQMGKYIENMVNGMIQSGKGPLHSMIEKIIEKKLTENRNDGL